MPSTDLKSPSKYMKHCISKYPNNLYTLCHVILYLDGLQWDQFNTVLALITFGYSLTILACELMMLNNIILCCFQFLLLAWCFRKGNDIKQLGVVFPFYWEMKSCKQYYVGNIIQHGKYCTRLTRLHFIWRSLLESVLHIIGVEMFKRTLIMLSVPCH